MCNYFLDSIKNFLPSKPQCRFQYPFQRQVQNPSPSRFSSLNSSLTPGPKESSCLILSQSQKNLGLFILLALQLGCEPLKKNQDKDADRTKDPNPKDVQTQTYSLPTFEHLQKYFHTIGRPYELTYTYFTWELNYQGELKVIQTINNLEKTNGLDSELIDHDLQAASTLTRNFQMKQSQGSPNNNDLCLIPPKPLELIQKTSFKISSAGDADDFFIFYYYKDRKLSSIKAKIDKESRQSLVLFLQSFNQFLKSTKVIESTISNSNISCLSVPPSQQGEPPVEQSETAPFVPSETTPPPVLQSINSPSFWSGVGSDKIISLYVPDKTMMSLYLEPVSPTDCQPSVRFFNLSDVKTNVDSLEVYFKYFILNLSNLVNKETPSTEEIY